MRLKQFANLLLAALFLAQSSSAMASAMVMSYAPEQVSEVAVDTPVDSIVSEVESGCHGQSPGKDTIASENCCDSMDQQCCLLGCLAVLITVVCSYYSNAYASTCAGNQHLDDTWRAENNALRFFMTTIRTSAAGWLAVAFVVLVVMLALSTFAR